MSPLLFTKHCFIRALKPDDVNELYAIRSNELVNKYIDRPSNITEEDVELFIQNINEQIKLGGRYYWAISLKEADKLIGTICLFNFSEQNISAEVGYELHPDFQNKGYMNEVLKEVIHFSFTELQLQELDAFINPNNEASKKLVQKNKFVFNENKKTTEVNKYEIFTLKKESNN
jgi:ribosomal-protein-alanine N-acetyltransferase